MSSPKAHSAASIILRGANDFMVDEMERSIHDSLCVVRRVLESKSLVTGGGAVEAALSIYLENYAHMLVRHTVSEINKNRQTDGDRQTNRETDIRTERQTDTRTDRQRDRQTDKWTDIQMDRHIDRQTHRQTDRDGQTGRWTNT